jgi:hypothetical protein
MFVVPLFTCLLIDGTSTPRVFDEHNLSYEEWKSVLHLSTRWGFASIRQLALASINPPTPYDRLLLARTYSVDDWVVPALSALCGRTAPLSLDEALHMKIEDVVLVVTVREDIRKNTLRVEAAEIPLYVEAAKAGKLSPFEGFDLPPSSPQTPLSTRPQTPRYPHTSPLMIPVPPASWPPIAFSGVPDVPLAILPPSRVPSVPPDSPPPPPFTNIPAIFAASPPILSVVGVPSASVPVASPRIPPPMDVPESENEQAGEWEAKSELNEATVVPGLGGAPVSWGMKKKGSMKKKAAKKKKKGTGAVISEASGLSEQ